MNRKEDLIREKVFLQEEELRLEQLLRDNMERRQQIYKEELERYENEVLPLKHKAMLVSVE